MLKGKRLTGHVDFSINVEKPEKKIGFYFSNSFPVLDQRYNGDVQHCAWFWVQHDAPSDGK